MKVLIGLALLAYFFYYVDLNKLLKHQTNYTNTIDNTIIEAKRTKYYKLLLNKEVEVEDKVIENITFED